MESMVDTVNEIMEDVAQGQQEIAGDPAGETAQATVETDGSAADAEAQQEPEKPKKLGGYQRKLEKLARENAELKARLGESTPEQPAALATKPTLEQFNGDFEAYTEASYRYLRQQEQLQEQQNAIAQTSQQRMKAFAETVPDFYDVIAEADFQIPPIVSQAIQEWESGPQIAYELAKNPEIADRIAGLSPVNQALELARLEADIKARASSAGKPKPATSQTKAPAPVTPVRPAAATVTVEPQNMAYEDFVKWRNSGGR